MAQVFNIDPDAAQAVLERSLNYQASQRNQTPPGLTPPPTPKQMEAVGPTSKWARLSQIGVGKANLYNAYRTVVEHKGSINANNKAGFSQAAQGVKDVGKGAFKVGASIASAPVGLAKDTNKNLIQPAVKEAGQFGHLVAHPTQLASELKQGGSPQLVQQVNVYKQAVNNGKLSPATQKFASSFGDSKATQAQIGQVLSKGGTEKDVQVYLTNKLASQNKTINKMLAEAGGTALLFAGGEEAGSVVKGGEGIIKGTIKNSVIGGFSNVASLIQSNPNASSKEVEKAFRSGAEFGAATTVLGGVGGKIAGGLKTVLGKDKASATDLKNVATNQLINKGRQAGVTSNVGKIATETPTASKLTSMGKQAVTGAKAITDSSHMLPTHTQALQTRLDQINSRMNELQGKVGTTFKPEQSTLETAGTTRLKTNVPVKANGEPNLKFKSAKSQGTFAPEKGNAVPNESLAEYQALKEEKANITKQLAEAPSEQVTKIKNEAKTVSNKSQATEATIPKEESLSQKITKPSTQKESTPLVNTNQPKAKGLGGLVSKAADVLHISGKLNPEQALLNKGHTDAAQVVREISANRDAGNYLGERAKAQFDKTASKSEQNYETFASEHEIAPKSNTAHTQFTSTLQDTGKRAAQAGVIEAPRGENYVPRYAKFNDTTKSSGIGGLQKSGGFSKGRVQAGEFGLGGDKYPTYSDFKNAVEKNNGKVSQATTGEVLGHTVASREKAIANANGLAKLEKTTMADDKPAIATIAPGKSLPAELSGYDTNLLPGRAVHPDLVPAIKTFVQGPGKSNILSKLNSITKRLVTVNGAVHDLNYARSAVGEQGLFRTIRNFHPTNIVQKGLDNEQYHQDTLRMIKNGMVTSRTGLTNIFDEQNSALNKKVGGVLGALRGKIDKVTFGIGDNLGRATYLKVEKGLINKGLSAKEAGQTAADIANRVMFTEREGQQSAESKSIGKIALFAKNYFQSTLQKATVATGISKNKALSQVAQKAAQVQAAKALAKTFTYLFAAAQGINYATTGHSTFQNKDSKISPVFYVDKTTGKSYHLTNWYGQIGELLHLTDPKAIINKLSPGVQEIARVVSNTDQLGYSNSGNVRNTSSSGVRQWGEILSNSLEHLVTPAGIDSTKFSQVFGKGGQPGKVSAANLMGFGTSTTDESGMEKDILNRYYATLPAGASKTPPALSTLEAAARNDLAKGNANSSNLQKLQSQMTPTQYKLFLKTGADNPAERAFAKLGTDQKLEIIEKYSPQQLQELNPKTIADTLVGSSAKGVITSLQNKGFSTQRIQQDLQKIGIESNQLRDLKAKAKIQATIKARQAARQPKFVNPLLK